MLGAIERQRSASCWKQAGESGGVEWRSSYALRGASTKRTGKLCILRARDKQGDSATRELTA